MPNLYWIVVEDANKTCPFIAELFKRYNIKFAHLHALTPPEKKPNEADPNWKIARGVVQRNKALLWLRCFGFLHEKFLIIICRCSDYLSQNYKNYHGNSVFEFCCHPFGNICFVLQNLRENSLEYISRHLSLILFCKNIELQLFLLNLYDVTFCEISHQVVSHHELFSHPLKFF